MAKIIDEIKAKARQLKKHIVLPDATDERAIRAARIIVDEQLSDISLVGNEDTIRTKAQQLGVSLEKVHVVDPEKSKNLNDFTNIYFDLRKAKGMPLEQAQKTIRLPQ
jgi:phosphotransacetylase